MLTIALGTCSYHLTDQQHSTAWGPESTVDAPSLRGSSACIALSRTTSSCLAASSSPRHATLK